MVQRGKCACFQFESCATGGISGHIRRQDLDGDHAMQSLIPRPPHLPHATSAEQREQPAAHFLYQEIDGLSTIDKTALRARLGETLRRPAAELRTLNVPTLWLTGDEDIVYPPFLSDLLAPMMPNARVVRVPSAGHSVYFERPAEFNRVVNEFLGAHP